METPNSIELLVPQQNVLSVHDELDRIRAIHDRRQGILTVHERIVCDRIPVLPNLARIVGQWIIIVPEPALDAVRKIAGQVMADGTGISGVSVVATGPEGDVNAVTDNAGNYSFSGLRAGDYTIAIDNIPTDWVFTVTSQDITLGTGEAKVVSFFGEAAVAPVTAAVYITSVTTPAGVAVNPAAVARSANSSDVK